ncbi:MAG TPA: 3'(2'),5'-bisphosphate nucleotidase CysQ [Steroidobacteraceae bacterium]|jgi:3'(2'), 5'-bisphosphate nucleotidase|nr:3'(2'),5'-bisphosphate nucleotidase CysQ [Steroidobacteraceae bacterium]
MIDAAREAGQAANRIYHGTFAVHTKSDDSPVTAADHVAEEIILRALRSHAPGIAVVAEEQAAAGHIPAVATEFFLVDPLDGTKEFIQRRGDFTVNIALIRHAAPALGVVYAPAKGQLFAGNVATRSARRAWLDPDTTAGADFAAIRVRELPAAGLIAVASRSHRTPQTDAYLARYHIAELVAVGSSLKFCLVAAGEADLYPRLGPTMEWDTAAGHAVLLAAGGQVFGPDAQPLGYGKPQYRNPWFVASGAFVPHALAA